jgi:hypothetical protein
MTKTLEITETLVRTLLDTVDAGLCCGKGEPIPGQMCVEAAVCYAMGLPHGDEPTCVSSAVRAFKISLNDSAWSSNDVRAKGMRKLAVAQLGSRGVVDDVEFSKRVARKTIQRIVPIAMRAIGLEAEAKQCEEEGSQAAARAAADAARADAAAAADAAYDAAAAAARAYAARAYAARDSVLIVAAGIALETLIELKSPGAEWLHLCDAR